MIRARALLAAVTLACAAMIPSHSPALAQDAAPDVGWWTSNQIAGVPIGRALLVPPGGSQVAAGADEAVSVAAVRFPAGAGGAAYRVGIELGSDTEDVTVIACPVLGPWDAARGAPLSEAPPWDCTVAQSAGTIDVAARTISWDLPSDFVRDGNVEAMLLPPEAGRSFTLTMSAPDDRAVSPLPEPSPTTTPNAAPTPTTAPAPRTDGPDTGPTAAPPPTSSVAPGAIASPVPPPTAPAGLPSPLPTAPPATTPDAEVAAAVTEDPSSTAGRVLGGSVLGALLAGAALVFRRSPPAAADAGRGVGRFVRPRTEPPLSI